MAVTVDWPALHAAWEAAEWGDFIWELVLEERRDVALLVNGAIDEVNQLHDPVPGPGGPSSEWCTETVPGVAALIRPVGELHEVRAWYDELARRLEARGIAGRLVPGRPDPRPEWLQLPSGPVVPTAILALPVVDSDADVRGWEVAPDDVAAVAEVVASWIDAAAGELFLTRYLFTDVLPDSRDLAITLRRSARRAFSTTVARALGPGQGRLAVLHTPGVLTLQLAGEPDRLAAVDVLLDLVRSLGPRAALAGVRLAPVPTRGWRTTAGLPPVSPSWDPTRMGSEEHRIDQLPKLRRAHVIDAYGAQVLTDEHLGRLSGLLAERWLVEPLGAGRHLVVARDLAAWFMGDVPDPALLAAARTDLAPLLLTPDVSA